MRAVLVFCEGNHDIVFVTRSLGAVAGCSWVGTKIKDLPSPFGVTPGVPPALRPRMQSFIVERYSGRTLGDEMLRGAQHPPAPAFQSVVHHRSSDTLYVMLRMGTDSAHKEVIQMLTLLEQTMVNGAGVLDVTELACAFLFDADAAGLNARETSFKADYGAWFPNLAQVAHGTWDKGTRGPVGLYVFHDPNHQDKAGTLEEHLAPLVQAHWPHRWQDAHTFLQSHGDGEPVSQKPAERLKAAITLAGQPTYPGDPMSVVIDRDKHNRGLPATSFTGHESQALVTFLQSVPW